MPDLLSSEERDALQARYSRSSDPVVVPAIFPSVTQLDAARTSALTAAVTRWFESVATDLSRLLRVPCVARPPRQESVAPEALPPGDDVALWTAVKGSRGHRLLLSLPRVFAVTVCERILGAPMVPREDRTLTAAEVALLHELARTWTGFAAGAWKEVELGLCDARGSDPRSMADGTDRSSDRESAWIQLSSELVCGPVEGAIRAALAPSTVRLLHGEAPATDPIPLNPENIRSRLADVPIELRAVVGEVDFRVDDLENLCIGDIIALDRRADEPIDLVIGERVVFRGKAGLSGQQIAVELIAPCES